MRVRFWMSVGERDNSMPRQRKKLIYLIGCDLLER